MAAEARKVEEKITGVHGIPEIGREVRMPSPRRRDSYDLAQEAGQGKAKLLPDGDTDLATDVKG